jgi:tetratricopeptide (TPR) repeat protein
VFEVETIAKEEITNKDFVLRWRLAARDVTASLVAHRFRTERIDAYDRLLAEIDDPGEARLVRGRATPFVGRERELVTLDAMYDECVSEPIARLAVVTGGAGEGKSRLRHEFVKRLLAREDSPAVVVARGDPLSAGSAFAMLGQALSRAVGLNAVESIEKRREHLRARVAHHVPAHDADRVAQFVGEVVNTPFDDAGLVQLRAARLDPMLMGDQIRRAGEDLLEAESGAYPVLIVLEDLQWGDLATVQFIDGALRRLKSRPFMVLALARHEVQNSFPALFASHAATTLQLSGLTKKSCEKIARAVLGDTQPALHLDRVVTHAAGNPFYLEELLRSVGDGDDGASLPESVLAMMQSRIEALDASARRILRAASVFGTTFVRDGVASLVGADLADDVDEWLAELTRREWIAVRSEATREFAFRQEALREAAYAMLTDADARIGHRLAGEWLHRTGRADPLSLAEHFRRGGANDRAVGCFVDAVRQLLEGNDLQGVLRAADLALAIGATGESRGELRLAQAEAHRWRGQNTEAGACAREAIALLPRDSTSWFRALGEIVMAAGRTGDVETLVTHAELITDAPLPVDPQTDEARRIAGARASIQLLHAGQTAIGERVLVIVSEGIESLRERHPLADAWIETARLGRALGGGDPVTARVHAQAAVAGCERAGDLRTACMQRVNLGFTAAETGALGEAEQTLREAVDTARRMGLRDALGIAQSNLGLALTHLGRYDEAIHIMREVIDSLAAENRLLEGCTRGYIAIAYQRRGDLVEAEREARLAVVRLAKSPSARAYALATLSRILVARGEAREALSLAQQAHELAGTAAAEEGDAAVRLALAEALRAVGDRDGSRAAIRVARERLTDRAAQIPVSSARVGFLRGPPDHVATFAFDPDA